MKDCRHIQILLPDFLSGRAGDDERKSIERHLLTCRSCQMAAAELTRTFAALKESDAQGPPQSYWQNFLPRVHQRLEERERGGLVSQIARRYSPWVSKILIPSAALLATIFVLLRVQLVPQHERLSSDLRALVNEMNSNEIREVTETSLGLLLPDPTSRVSSILVHDEETRQALSSLIAVSRDEIERFQEVNFLSSPGTGVESLNDEELETVIQRLRGIGTL